MLLLPAYRPAVATLLTAAIALGTSPSLLPVGAAAYGQQEHFTPHDVAKLREARSVAMSPDGAFVAYTFSVPRRPFHDENGRAWMELHVVDPSGRDRTFVGGEVNVDDIAFTPDGDAISFLQKRDGDEHKALYVIPIDGGEARKILGHDTAIAAYDWSPDGTRIAFLAKQKKDKGKKKLEDNGFNAIVYEEEVRYTRVWIAEVADSPEDNSEPRMLDLDWSATGVRWSPAGPRLAVAMAPTPLVDDRLMKTRLHVVDADTGELIIRFNNPGKLGSFAWSPNGEHLAFVSGENEHDPREGRLVVAPAETGLMRDLLDDYQGHVTDVAWRDTQTVLYTGDEGCLTTFGRVGIDGSGQHTIVPTGGTILESLEVSRSGRHAAFIAETPRHPNEVYYMKHGDKGPRRLTDSNPWLERVRFADQEVIEHRARDGLLLQGILIHPLDESPGRRYPLIVSAHGGPESHNSNGWLTHYVRPGQVAAAAGYAVFYPNYRGSTGRGVEFSKMGQSDYGGKEFDDIVDGVEHLVSIGLVDRERVGITGGSYGGYASGWGATALTEHYAAAVMMMGISDQVSKAGTTDIPNEMYLVHSRRWPWKHWDWFRERSPIYYVEQAKTPLLILHGEADTRVHPSQSLELYRYMKLAGKAPVRLVLYPDEPHGFRRAGARLDYNMRMMRWMDHYLKGPGGEPPPIELEYGFEVEDDDNGDGESDDQD